MNAHNPAAEKFQITDKPMALPAKCVVCGAVDRPVLDFGMSLDYYGAILFCTECIAAAATAIGYAPVAEIDQLREHASRVANNYMKVLDLIGRRVNDINAAVGKLPGDIEQLILTEPLVSTEEQSEEYAGTQELSEWTEPATESVFESDSE